MGDREIPLRPEEQYPLLKVDAAGGDIGGHPHLNQTQMTQGWGVTCTKKPSWFSRWPEFISGCWMTLILFGISFLVFYALGMGAYRRQQVIIVKCNNSKPASNVYFHQIIQRGSLIPIAQYSDFLAYLSMSYPLLRFNVYFLIDDTYLSSQRGARHSRFINKIIPYGLINYKMEDNIKEAIHDFQRRYENVNFTIMPLSKYMALSSMKAKWKNVPHTILPFYLRVFAVWEDGGIGMDLTTYNNLYKIHQFIDRKTTAILKQHNDGINVEEYSHALNKIDKEDDTAFFSMFYGLLNTVLNQTRSFINKTKLFIPPMTTESNKNQPVMRTHRTKREVFNDSMTAAAISFGNDTILKSEIQSEGKNQTADINVEGTMKKTGNESNVEINVKLPHTKINGSGDSFAPLILVYDLSFVSDAIGPSYLLSESNDIGADSVKPKVPIPQRPAPHILSLDMDGTFIASSAKLHPFLGNLLSAVCQRVPPKLAIQDVLLTRCSSVFRNDIYCNNLYIL